MRLQRHFELKRGLWSQPLQVRSRSCGLGTAVVESEKLVSGDCAAVGVVAAEHRAILTVSLRLSGLQKANTGLT